MTHSVLSLPVASVLLVCACLFVPFVRTIEVHEDVNEGPTIGAHLRAVNASIPHTNATAGPPVVERNVNDLPPPSAPPLLHRPREQIATANASPTASEPSAGEQPALVANNFTAFPSNHKQHSGASTVHGQTSSPLTTEVVAIAGITSVLSPATPTPPVTAAVGGLSSFRAAYVCKTNTPRKTENRPNSTMVAHAAGGRLKCVNLKQGRNRGGKTHTHTHTHTHMHISRINMRI